MSQVTNFASENPFIFQTIDSKPYRSLVAIPIIGTIFEVIGQLAIRKVFLQEEKVKQEIQKEVEAIKKESKTQQLKYLTKSRPLGKPLSPEEKKKEGDNLETEAEKLLKITQTLIPNIDNNIKLIQVSQHLHISHAGGTLLFLAGSITLLAMGILLGKPPMAIYGGFITLFLIPLAALNGIWIFSHKQTKENLERLKQSSQENVQILQENLTQLRS